MGQGNLTGLTSLVAEELDADWAQMRSEAAPSDATRYNNLNFGPMQGTGGSSAIANSYLQYRSAGAAARAMLVAAAADAWKVPAAEVTVSKGVLAHPSGKRATFGEMAEAASRQQVPEKPALKEARQFAVIGKDRSAPRVDSPAKCNGSAVYTIDVKLPGLLTAVIAFPPSFGAKVVSFDATAAKQVKGVTDVVQVPEGVAVVATGTWAALQGRRALRVQWDESTSNQLDSDKLLALYREEAGKPGKPFARPAAAAGAGGHGQDDRGGLRVPLPRPRGDGADELRRLAARRHARDLERPPVPELRPHVRRQGGGPAAGEGQLHTVYSGGSFGRRANAWSDFTVAAVNVAKAIDGRAPVRLQFTPRRRHRRGPVPADVRACRQGRPRRQRRHRRVEARHRRPVDRRRHADGGDGQGRHRSDLGRRRHRVALRRCR